MKAITALVELAQHALLILPLLLAPLIELLAIAMLTSTETREPPHALFVLAAA